MVPPEHLSARRKRSDQGMVDHDAQVPCFVPGTSTSAAVDDAITITIQRPDPSDEIRLPTLGPCLEEHGVTNFGGPPT